MVDTDRRPKFKRILLKLSGEALAGEQGFGIDPKILDAMAIEIGQLIGIGVQVGLVLGGGNLFRGATCFEGQLLTKRVWTELLAITWACWPQL